MCNPYIYSRWRNWPGTRRSQSSPVKLDPDAFFATGAFPAAGFAAGLAAGLAVALAAGLAAGLGGIVTR